MFHMTIQVRKIYSDNDLSRIQANYLHRFLWKFYVNVQVSTFGIFHEESNIKAFVFSAPEDLQKDTISTSVDIIPIASGATPDTAGFQDLIKNSPKIATKIGR